MAGTETTDLVGLLQNMLAADGQIGTAGSLALHGWWKDTAQTDPSVPPPWPFGILQIQSALDVTFMSAIRVGVDGLVTCKVVGLDKTFTSTVRPAARQMDTLLQGFQASNGNVLLVGKLIRETVLDYSEAVNGQIIRHLGGVYRFLAQ
jgi:hypothetical protein